jgi:Domain of Unknown Function (DUF928)
MREFSERLGKLLLLASFAWPGLASAQDSSNAVATTAAAPPAVIYRPAKGSAPSARVTGGSRGSGDATITLDVLAPDETGLTTQEQPSLFWFQSKPAKARFELTLIAPDKDEPILQVNIERASSAGIQRLRLADHGVKLATGVEYQWVIALVTDPDNRSTDLVASGFIKRVEPSAELKAKVAGADGSSLPSIYAEAGIWHDALSTLSDLIDLKPDNQALIKQRSDLLGQVGLKAAAAAGGATPGK